ncbi:hypothetical protein V8P49_12375 [Acinetobacter baumannii]
MKDFFGLNYMNVIPDYVDVEYLNGDLHVICFWDDINHKFNFPSVNSFRITQEGKTLRMQSEIDNYGESFLSASDGLDLYKWLNKQNYGYLDGLNLYKYLLVSSCEILEIICGEEIGVLD